MNNLQKNILMLEQLTGKKIVLKESISLESMAATKQPKKIRDGLAALIAMKNMDVISEREFNKALGTLPYNLGPELINIPYALRGDGELDYMTYSDIQPSVTHGTRNILDKIDGYNKIINSQTEGASEEAKEICRKNISMLKEWLPFAEEINALRVKVKSVKEINQTKEREEIKGRTNPQVQKAVDMIAEDFRVIIEQNWLSSFQNKINDWKKDVEKNGTTDIDVLYPTSSIDRRAKDYEVQRHRNEINGMKKNGLYKLLVKNGNEYSAKTDDEILQMAIYESKEEIKSFEFKMAHKLGGLLPQKEMNLDVKKIAGNNKLRNEIMFNINNNESYFLVQNSIVTSFSKYGLPFHRFPTTFHNLVVKGQKMKNPDELTVKKALNAAY